MTQQQTQSLLSDTSSSPHRNPNKLTLLTLTFLIYFEVAGGPYGSEPVVQAAGPLYALLAFLIFPFVWCLPESLVTAELSTAIPGNGGFVLWAHHAFGPFCASLMATWKFLSAVINTAAFPVNCVDYLAMALPSLAAGPARTLTVVSIIVALTLVNYTGLTVVGLAAVALGVASLAPFALMAAMSVPRIRTERWLARGISGARDWRLFFNTLFWNLNFWDTASAMAGEVEEPGRTFPRALAVAGVMTSLGYLLPLMAGIGAVESSPKDWVNGYFATLGGIIGGKWLKLWIQVGAVLSNIGLYEASLSGSSFQLLGMADLGLLPRIYASKAKWFNTPWVGILTSTLITLAISFMTFENIVASANFLYSLGMLMEFAAFVWLRKTQPELQRPYRVPLGIPGLVILCSVPSALLIFVMAISTKAVFTVCVCFTLFGIALYYIMRFCKSRGFLKFTMSATDYIRVDDEKNQLGD